MTEFDKKFIGKIVNATVDAIIAIDSRGVIELFNSAAEDIFGYTQEEALGSDVSLLMHTHDADHHSKYLTNYLEHGHSTIIQAGPRALTGRRKDGTSFHMDLALNEMKSEGETFFVAIIRDITERIQTEEKLQSALSDLSKFRMAIDSSSDYFFLIQYPSFRIVDVNTTAINELGYDKSQLCSLNPDELIESFGQEEVRRQLTRLCEDTSGHYSMMTRLHGQEGVRIPVEIFLTVIPDGNESIILATARDVKERLDYEQKIEHSRRLLIEAQNIAQFGSWEWDLSTDRLTWSDEVFRIFGLDPESFIPTQSKFLNAITPEYTQQVVSGFRTAIANNERFSQEFDICTADGGTKIIHLQARVYTDHCENPTRMLGTIQDISERKQAERELEYLSNYDSLTALPNRKLFMDRLQHALTTARRNATRLGLIFIDLDHFKKVNDSLGHHIGDVMLTHIAQRIQDVLREGDTVARLGGDEFVIIIESLTHVDDAALIAKKVIDSITRPLEIEGYELFPGTSLGISIYPDDGRQVSDLLKYADMAMYSAKAAGRNSFHFYSNELDHKAQRHMKIEQKLHHALENKEFYLVYQPLISVETNRIVGLEALLRWMQPPDGYHAPSDFIPVLEESGLIHEVGEWVIRTAALQLKFWQLEGLPRLRLSLNISSKQFQRPGFLSFVRSCVEEADIKPGELEFEITESVLVENIERSIDIMNGLRELGISLSIDDFGKGYSSLTYLKKFPISTLKIDKSFVSDLGQDTNGEAITDAVIALGKALGLRTIAEGVESIQQQDYLSRSGCNEVQGYLYSRPMTANNVSDLFNRTEFDPGYPIYNLYPSIELA